MMLSLFVAKTALTHRDYWSHSPQVPNLSRFSVPLGRKAFTGAASACPWTWSIPPTTCLELDSGPNLVRLWWGGGGTAFKTKTF